MWNYDVFGLNIAMHDALIMEVFDCLPHFLQFFWGVAFTYSLILFQHLEKSSFLHILKNQVDTFSILEESIKLNYVFMVTEGLKLDFKQELFDHKIWLYGNFTNLFQNNQELGLLMYGLVDSSKFALAQRFANHEIMNSKLTFVSECLLESLVDIPCLNLYFRGSNCWRIMGMVGVLLAIRKIQQVSRITESMLML